MEWIIYFLQFLKFQRNFLTKSFPYALTKVGHFVQTGNSMLFLNLAFAPRHHQLSAFTLQPFFNKTPMCLFFADWDRNIAKWQFLRNARWHCCIATFFHITQCFARGTSAQRLILNFGIILSDDLCSDSRSVTHFLFSNVLLSPQCYGKWLPKLSWQEGMIVPCNWFVSVGQACHTCRDVSHACLT